MHVAAADKPVHGGPCVHDGKFGHGTHVLLRGGHVQRGGCAPAAFAVRAGCPVARPAAGGAARAACARGGRGPRRAAHAGLFRQLRSPRACSQSPRPPHPVHLILSSSQDLLSFSTRRGGVVEEFVGAETERVS